MVVLRNDKYRIGGFVNGLIKVYKNGCSEPSFFNALKFVDVENDAVFILNADSESCEPTYGTLRRVEDSKVRIALQSINRQLNEEREKERLVV